MSLLAVVPSSANYTLKSYDFGNGSGAGTSSSYALQGQAGSSGGNLSGTSYSLPAGIHATNTVPVPAAPTLSDDNSAYNQLHLTLNVSGFASDTRYLIAISSDNFTTTKYVQLDDTIGSSVSVANYQTYAAWGGSSGFYILGLNSSTSYSVKVAALQGSATGSAFGPTASASTSAPSVTFGLSTSLTGTPPFGVAFGSLTPGSVVSGGATIIASLTSNAANGGSVIIGDQNGGLKSSAVNNTIASATADLSSASSGYGAQVSSVSQTSGGPLTAASPFNGSGNSVGGLSTSWQTLASFGSPLTGGSVSAALYAKSSSATPSAGDYSDIVTISISLLF